MKNIGIWIAVAVIILGGAYWIWQGGALSSKTDGATYNTDTEYENGVASGAMPANEMFVGSWQSNEDAKFVREFRADGTTDDLYESAVVSSGNWATFTNINAPEVAFPLEDNVLYLQITGDDTLTFKVVNITPETLELVYMDRGGVLTFTKI